ncbi:YciI family protein [Rouxiella chamberiensis]|uniref:YciI family protein n=1 Tax=Rouxiella chamberiensis TaxID=1513468 RepID=A0ABY7HTG5_9GAMM|nr:YciI family protein [Rouxiella chamberiensis]WAT02714.1 YciI family protein [Rouxiella chamberiensis]
MLYVIYSEDVTDSLEKRRLARPAHIERLLKLKEQGRVVLGGPFPAIDSEEPGDAGMTGSLVIAEFDSLEAAKSWAEVDPYVLAGVYENVTVKPFKQTL